MSNILNDMQQHKTFRVSFSSIIIIIQQIRELLFICSSL